MYKSIVGQYTLKNSRQIIKIFSRMIPPKTNYKIYLNILTGRGLSGPKVSITVKINKNNIINPNWKLIEKLVLMMSYGRTKNMNHMALNMNARR